jgi:conjugal transfer mating pair stabilization protein TraG
MFDNFTIYTIWGDLGLLTAVLNGMAMIAGQTGLVWGFAILASTYALASNVTKLSLGASAAGAVAGNIRGIVMPLILAMLMTGPQFKARVTVESSTSGRVTVVNVPAVLAVLPAVSSTLSKEMGEAVGTAFQSTGTDYARVSAQGAGFVNPLKQILSARSAVKRLASVEAELTLLISRCLTPDSGIDYSHLRNTVINGGNSGGRSAGQSMQFGPLPAGPTAVGSLLWYAYMSQGGTVPELQPNGQTIYSCSSAAVAISENIGRALTGPEFDRVSRGSVNATDQVNAGGDYTYTGLVQTHQAVRSANARTVAEALADGSQQAVAETINLLFYETVEENLACLGAKGEARVQCAAQIMQANELQRVELSAAANATQVVQFAGQFAGYMTALSLALGPLVLMVLMFAGVSASALATIAGATLLPLLTIDVGAVIIHSMMMIDVATFWQTLAKGGYLSHALVRDAYLQLALKIGTASQLMAALPAVLAGLFVAFRHASSVSGAKMANDRATAGVVAPSVMSAAPIMKQASMVSHEQLLGGGRLGFEGALPAAQASLMKSHGAEWNDTVARSRSREQSASEGQELARRLSHGESATKAHGVSLSKSNSQALSDAFRKHYDASATDQAGKNVSDGRSNTNSSGVEGAVSAGVRGSVGLGGPSASLDASATATARTGTSAQDSVNRGQTSGSSEAVRAGAAMDKAIAETRERARRENWDKSEQETLERMATASRTYNEVISERNSTTKTDTQLERAGEQIVSDSKNIGAREIGHQMAMDGDRAVNGDYRMYQATAGRAFESMAASQPYMDRARDRMASLSVDQLRGVESPEARNALQRHLAATMMLEDKSLNIGSRRDAGSYLAGQMTAMTGHTASFTPSGPSPTVAGFDGAPGNRTGLTADALDRDKGRGRPADVLVSGTGGGQAVKSPAPPSGSSGGARRASSPARAAAPSAGLLRQPTADSRQAGVLPRDPGFAAEAARRQGDVAAEISTRASRVGGAVGEREQLAADKGLSADNPRGTVARTGKNLATNVEDMFSDKAGNTNATMPGGKK